jgi:hypothetical protein
MSMGMKAIGHTARLHGVKHGAKKGKLSQTSKLENSPQGFRSAKQSKFAQVFTAMQSRRQHQGR